MAQGAKSAPSNADAYAAIRAVNASVTVRDGGGVRRARTGRGAREGARGRAREGGEGSGWDVMTLGRGISSRENVEGSD